MRLCRAQVTLSRRLYDFVDRRISLTDVDIKHFDGELDRERKKLGLPTSKVHTLLLCCPFSERWSDAAVMISLMSSRTASA